jgi:RNA polymerase sigma factor for flagellar operon FliA
MDAATLFRSRLALIDSVVACVCRRARMRPADAEDFASEFKLALIENDYANLRRYEGRSSLGTYLTVIAQRLLADRHRAQGGRWRPSAAATQMGEAGLLVERALRREGRTIDEILPALQALDPSLTRRDVEAMEAKLPSVAPRPRAVELDPIAEIVPGGESADARAIETEARRLGEQTNDVVRHALASLTLEDRAILRLHFASSMSIADISRAMRLPQRPLYRRVERALAQIRRALADAGIDASAVESLTSRAVELDFGGEWQDTSSRPTKESEDSIMAATNEGASS